MTYTKIDIAAFISKTTIFYLFVGALVGTVFTIPFFELISHRAFKFPESLNSLLLGYLIFGMPVAGITGLIYGVLCSISRRNGDQASLWLNVPAAISGATLPSIFFMASIFDDRHGFLETLRPFFYLAIFAVVCSVVTAWLHCRASNRFQFLRLKLSGAEE